MKPLYVILNAAGHMVTMTTDPEALKNWQKANRGYVTGEESSGYRIFELKAKDVTLDKPAQLPVIPDE